MKRVFFLILALHYLAFFSAKCQDLGSYQEDSISIEGDHNKIFGSIIIPYPNIDRAVALIIAGSGPTDRNGNNPMMKNNSLKMLAESLAEKGIASLRYDKRGVAASLAAGMPEKSLRFEHYIDDAISWMEMLSKDERFDKTMIIGHSEGSLIGMIAAARSNTDAFISIAGPGEAADLVLKRQLISQPPFIRDRLYAMIDSLKEGFTLKKVDPSYYTLFRPSVQPYLISWFRYDPQIEIKKLNIPILIIQGSTDIQVGIEDAEKLKKAVPEAKLTIIKGMNHIFKPSSSDRQENIATYRDPDLPIVEELIREIVDCITALE